ncbi:hypothetical protein Q4508_16905 [Amphritea sp. 2_MG-2023]|jgi:hypothetical protein|uniref:hypothetical protein n=1 Tax=Amphritea TaxID=515417 RepID=UPI001C06707E|nr:MULTISPECIES: hypothetical protein [Amphritea]MBU2966298.1 hypothetical protein [Amphritea atlantica]MDO6420237.1 hypothetical protein [Amphritea sp. 2_MG-2023]MDX2422657.1 hypothetical protein [Amphritea sp.]
MKKAMTVVFAMTFMTAPAFADQHDQNDISAEYIAGFLAGANLTDGAIIKNISTGEESEFLQRAYRTRLGKKHPSTQVTYLAGFCLPEGIDDKTVINKVTEKLKTTTYPEKTQRDIIVYNTIKSLYPCNE